MRKILLLILIACAIVSTSAQDKTALAKSDSLFAKGVELYKLQKYNEAIPYFTESDKIDKAELDSMNLRRDYSAMWLASCYFHIGDSVTAEYLYPKYYHCEPVDRRLTVEFDSLYYLGNSYAEKGQYSQALDYMLRCATIAKKIVGKNHYCYGNTVNYVSSIYASIGRYEYAIRFAAVGLDVVYQVFGVESPDYVSLLNFLASCYSSLGNYFESVRLASESLRIIEKSLGKENQFYVAILNKLASYYSCLGNYFESVRVVTESLRITEKSLGKENQIYATILNNLACSYSDLGNYAEALRLRTEALEIIGSLYGTDNLEYATSLSNLASVYAYLGNYTEAVRLGTEALEIKEALYGIDNIEYATSLSNLACIYVCLCKYTEALRLGTEALEIREKVFGKEHSDYVNSLGNITHIQLNLGNYTEALRLGTEALEIAEIVFGKENLNYAVLLNNLALCHFELGNYAEAVRAETETQEIRAKLLGKVHPDYISSLAGLCMYHVANHSIGCDSLDKWVTEINQQLPIHIREQFSGLSSNERSLLWDKYKVWFEQNINWCAYNIPTESNVSNAYDAALLSKGILLQSDIELSRLLLENGDEDLMDKYKELRLTRLMLNKLYEKPIAERIMSTDSIERVATALERELVLRSKTFGDFTHNMAIGWKDVQKQLKKKDIAVEFVSFVLENDSLMYAAYILTPDMQTPRMVPLFDSKQLENIKSTDYYRTSELSALIWGKLDEYLKGVDNIYFAPSGALYNIAIESLPSYNGDGMMYDRFKLYRLSSTRELAVIKDENEINDAVLYGGLQYDTDIEVLEDDAVKYHQTYQRDYHISNYWYSPNTRSGARYLPGTKTEVENINKSLKSASIKPQLYTGLQGTEGSFKDLSGKKTSIIHIATHGFCWNESEVRRAVNLSFLMNDDTPRYEDKAMTRSGLLFTGANNALMGKPIPENVNDGILTAKEIAALDLRGLDLVVLSACQTALGEITGDGVFGMQRGFKKAGANSILMTLWAIDDRAAQMLMTKFYEYLLGGKSKYESLILAQKYVREYEEDVEVPEDSYMTVEQKRRAEREGTTLTNPPVEKVKIKPFAAPKYWAAFILLDALN